MFLRFVTGVCLGSFCCVVAERLPLGHSLLRPRSHCPTCQTTLSWQELVPLLSFLWLKGRCRHCQSRIPASYFWAELLAGLLLISYPLSSSLHAFLWLGLSFTLALSDYFYLILEPKLFYPGTLFLGIFYLWQGGIIYWETLLYCLFLALICLLFLRDRFGLGDLWLLFAWSFWLPLQQFALLLLYACCAGLLAFGISALLQRTTKELPFIPFLTLGLWLVSVL